MADSEEECDTWRNRDKYPKEREEAKAKSPSPIEQRNDTRNDTRNDQRNDTRNDQKNEKRSFNNYQSPNKSVEPPFKRQRRDGADDYNFNSNNNSNNYNRENKDYRDNRREPSYDNRFNVVSNNNVPKPTDDVPNYPTQPPMLLFKYFLQQQDDDIEMDQAMKKYNEYKDSFVTKQLKAFFDSHSSQEWFREKYSPAFVEKKKLEVEKNIQLRKEIFTYLNERNWMDNIKIHVDENDSIVRLMDAVVILLEGGNAHDLTILDSKRYRSESPNDSHNIEDVVSKSPEKIVTTMESDEQVKEPEDKIIEEEVELTENVEKFDKKTESQEPRALHKTFSIFLRNLHPNVLRSEIEALVKPYNGFLRLALQDPTPDRKFFRRGWVTYDRTVNIKEICWNLNNIRLHDCDIGAIVNRELTQRIRPVMVLSNHKPVMRHDIKIASKLVAKFDKRHNLWQREDGKDTINPMSSNNPLLANITEYLVDEGSYEEEALLGGNLNSNLELAVSGSDPTNIKIEVDDKLATVLDKLILYLRFVHSFDYYSMTEYQIEDEMPHRCGILHARGAHIHVDKALTQKEVEEYIKSFESKAEQILNSVEILTIEEAKKLGYKTLDEAVDVFITENTQEIAKDKWLCPLSGKKFKGPDFVQKHILNKHVDKIDIVKQNTDFFNNYLLDPRRPQLPEHPSNRPGAKTTESGEIRNDNQFENKRYGGDMDSRNRNMDNNRNNGRRNDEFDNRRNNYRNDRGSSPSNGGYRDFGNRNNSSFGGDNRGGSNGNYYRKNNYPSRGNQSRQRNGGGSYYSRKMLSYNDLDAPMDD